MKLKFYPIVCTIMFLTLFAGGASAQIAGSVFRDMNANGTWDLSAPEEPGEFGVKVKAFNAVNSLIATATTDATGAYSFSAAQIAPGTPVRLQFILPGGNFSAKRTGADRSNVQFVTAGPAATNVDFAVASKKLLTDNANPYVVTTAATNGDALATGAGEAGDEDNLHVFPYDLSGDGGATRRAKNQYLGSVFGLAWQKESRVLLLAAYLKRHAGFGPNGIGAIYQTQIGTDGIPSTPTLLVDVKTIGIDVGVDPRTNPLPANAGAPNKDNGVFAMVGKTGIGDIELAENGRDLYLVNMHLKTISRINVGNPLKSSFSASDVTGTWAIPDPGLAGTEFHPMAINIHQGKVYVGGVASVQNSGIQDIADTANLRGIVYELNVQTGVFTAVLQVPFSYRRGFTNTDFRYEFRNNYWNAWQNNPDVSYGGPLRGGLIGLPLAPYSTGIYYPQPMISKIQFDVDGSMVIGVRDRFGDQAGFNNLFETGNVPGETYRALSSGEILRAGKTGNTWTLENNGSVTSAGITTTTLGLTSNAPLLSGSFLGEIGAPWGGTFGPGGGYYYYNHNFSTVGVPAAFAGLPTYNSHYVKCDGGLAIYPGYNELIMTAIDPVNNSYSNGLIKNVNLGPEAGNMAGRMELLSNTSGLPSHMGKACALGDIEVLIDAQAVEIGNRVWKDTNGNGRQDADEPGIAGVDVTLRSPGADGIYKTGDDEVWTVTTDANGNYYFDETIVNDSRRPSSWIGVSATNSGILPGFEYKVEISPAQAPLASMLLSATNAAGDDAIDNDGSYNVTTPEYIINPGGSDAPGSDFENNYNIDFGFMSNNLLALKKIDLAGQINNDVVKLTFTTKQELNNKLFVVERSIDGKNFLELAKVDSKGNGDFSYPVRDNVNGINSPVYYYRVKAVAMNGTSMYSAVIKLSVKTNNQVNTLNNPFTNTLIVQVVNDKKEDASIRVINAAGQVVLSQVQTVNSGVSNINIAGAGQLASGVYFLDVQMNSQHKQEKIIKQ